ncbi:MAG: integration host factor subunit beta [Desulfatitalea sp.]|nr:integration host factor subunit beta [Desulfatitalea sp.]NNK02865.1 integration host factor subunit beta [Desulfatitalea sp.]
MNKLELIATLGEQNDLPKAEAKRIVELFFDRICDALAKGDRVEIRGLCTFKVKSYDSYNGRNPKTGELVHVKPKRLPFFKPGADLKMRVDGSNGRH